MKSSSTCHKQLSLRDGRVIYAAIQATDKDNSDIIVPKYDCVIDELEEVYNDGLLDAFIISATNRRQLFSYLVKLVKGKHKESKYVEHVRTNKFTIITEQPIEGNLDGEALKTNKFEMTVIPKAITFYHNKELAEKIRERVKK